MESSPEPYLPHCSDAELLGLLSGQRRFLDPGGLPIPPWTLGCLRLAHLHEAEIAHSLEVTRRQARRIAAAFELHRRLCRATLPDRASLNTPELIAQMIRPWILDERERFWCVALDARGQMIGEPMETSLGDVDGTEASPRAFYRGALRVGASCAVAVHNHPSGSLTPSLADMGVTRRLVIAGHCLGLALRDHVIVTPDGRWESLHRLSPHIFRAPPEHALFSR